MQDPTVEHTAKVALLREQFLNAKAFHQKYGEGTITLVGMSHGIPWVEVAFADRRKLFSEPFEKLQILPKN